VAALDEGLHLGHRAFAMCEDDGSSAAVDSRPESYDVEISELLAKNRRRLAYPNGLIEVSEVVVDEKVVRTLTQPTGEPQPNVAPPRCGNGNRSEPSGGQTRVRSTTPPSSRG
jgi:hypothetical protein